MTAIAYTTAPIRQRVAAAGRSIEDLPADVPLYLVRAGQDEAPGLNPVMDRFVSAALRHNLPLRLVNHPTGPHAFDIMADSDASRAIVKDVLEFVRARLGA